MPPPRDRADGRRPLLALTAALAVTAPARAEPAPRPVHFVNDVMPLLSRYGCNGGGCHGRASGQNGFKLSVFGFDPGWVHTDLAPDGTEEPGPVAERLVGHIEAAKGSRTPLE